MPFDTNLTGFRCSDLVSKSSTFCACFSNCSRLTICDTACVCVCVCVCYFGNQLPLLCVRRQRMIIAVVALRVAEIILALGEQGLRSETKCKG